MSLPLVKLEPHVAGDTWVGIPTIGPLLINGLQPGVAAARMRLTLTLSRSQTVASVEFDTEAGEGILPITIVDAATWEFTIPEVDFADFDLPAGIYEGHLEITDVNGVRLTTHHLVLPILPDKTPPPAP